MSPWVPSKPVTKMIVNANAEGTGKEKVLIDFHLK